MLLCCGPQRRQFFRRFKTWNIHFGIAKGIHPYMSIYIYICDTYIRIKYTVYTYSIACELICTEDPGNPESPRTIALLCGRCPLDGWISSMRCRVIGRRSFSYNCWASESVGNTGGIWSPWLGRQMQGLIMPRNSAGMEHGPFIEDLPYLLSILIHGKV